MQGRFQQVQPRPFPSGYGETIAMLEPSPEWLAAQYGLSFFDGTDNLDDYRAAAIQLPSGRMVGILRHVGAPDEGVEVQADAHDDPAAAVDELLNCLGLPPSTCTWLRDESGVPAAAR